MRITAAIAQRFWSHVQRGALSECWPWQGSRDEDDYGRFKVDGKNMRANRVAYEDTYGPLPKGYCALHGCDNPPCVNPYHLYAGTRRKNSHDKALAVRLRQLLERRKSA